MAEKSVTYNDLPHSVKTGLGLLFSGWITFLVALYVYLGSYDFMKFFIALGILSYFIIRIRNWARVLGLLFNVIGIFYCISFSLAFFLRAANLLGSFIFLIIVLLMGASTYFLMRKESAVFFKTHIPKSGKDQQKKKENGVR